MADHAERPIEVGAEMDYAEHDRTYAGFLAGAKYTTLFLVTVLIAMAFLFFTSAGFISSLILCAILNAIGVYFLR